MIGSREYNETKCIDSIKSKTLSLKDGQRTCDKNFMSMEHDHEVAESFCRS